MSDDWGFLLGSEMFVDTRETKISGTHVDLSTDHAGSDTALRGREAVGSTRTGLVGLLETSEALTQDVGVAEDRTIPMTPPDDVPELIVSSEESDSSFAKPDGHLKEEQVTRGEEDIGNRGPVSDSGLGLSPTMAAREAADTPALPKVFFPGLVLVTEPKAMNGHTLRQLPVAEDVGSDQRLDDRQSPS
jgi:hypothetical protein